MLDEPIKRLGTFTVPVKIYHDERAEIKITVSKEEATAPGSAVDGQKNN
jgi:large subunit ribosomal protein L9